MMVPGLGDYETVCRKYRQEKERKLFVRRMVGICLLEFTILLIVAAGLLTNRCSGIISSIIDAIGVVLEACMPCSVIMGLSAFAVLIRYKVFPREKC